jgi:hypothetical protein
LIFFVTLGIQSEGNALRNEKPIVGFSFMTMLQAHRSVLVKDFLAKTDVTKLELS